MDRVPPERRGVGLGGGEAVADDDAHPPAADRVLDRSLGGGDLGVVGDVHKVLPKLIDALEQR